MLAPILPPNQVEDERNGEVQTVPTPFRPRRGPHAYRYCAGVCFHRATESTGNRFKTRELV